MQETLEERKSRSWEKNTVAIKNWTCNQIWESIYKNWSLWTVLRMIFFSLNLSIFVLLSLRSTLLVVWFTSPVFQFTFYKFIVLGFLGLNPSTFRAKDSNLILTNNYIKLNNFEIRVQLSILNIIFFKYFLL